MRGLVWLAAGCFAGGGLAFADYIPLDESVTWVVTDRVDPDFSERAAHKAVRDLRLPDDHIGVHQYHQETFGWVDPEVKDDLARPDLRLLADPILRPMSSPPLRRRVVGWHPYWVNPTAYQRYDYSKLDTLAYFSYEVNPTNGSYQTLRSWDTTPVIAHAQSQGAKVVLTATLFGSANNTALLSNPTSCANLIDSLVNVVSNRNGDGVNIDFESVSGSMRANLTTFLSNLTVRFHRDIPGSEVSVALPAIDWQDAFDVAAYDGFLDTMIIMGYDYHWRGGERAGPVAPLSASATWGSLLNVERSITDYLAKGVRPEKLLLGCPYYGYDWPTTSAAIPGVTTGQGTAVIYTNAIVRATTHGRQWNAAGASPYYIYTNASVVRQTWYEDAQSLGLKYDLVNAKDIGGIGIWALGYDDPQPELWELIGQKFTSGGFPWVARDSGTTTSFYGVAAAGSLRAAVGAGGMIRTSPDGQTWTARTSGTGDLLLNVNGASGVWVAVGDQGRVVTSPDGVAWTVRSTPTTNMLRAIAYGNGAHVAGGAAGTILRSTDGGVTWALQTSGTTSTLQGMLFAGGQFIAVGESGVLLTSSDGQTWTARTSNAGGWLLDSAYGNGLYVSAGLGSRIVTSPDGATWTRQTDDLPSASANLYRVAFADGRFVAVGESGVIWSSIDGIGWWAEDSGTTDNLRGIVHDGARFVAVGFNGTVLTQATEESGEPEEPPPPSGFEDLPAAQPAGSLSDIVVFTSAGHGAIGDRGATWIFGRPLIHGMVEDIGNIDQLNYFADYCFKAGATVVPMRPLGNQTNEVIVDNVSAGVTWGGTWHDSVSAIYYGNVGETPYRYAYIDPDQTTAWAIYRPNIPVTGYYPVYAWARHGSDRVRQLYRVYHSGGVTDVRVNHRRVGCGWVWLGTYHFEAGTGGSVNISNHAPGHNPANDVVIADAIRFGNGMGDVDRGYGVSRLEREMEASYYWVRSMVGQGMSSTIYGSAAVQDITNNVGAPTRMAAEMNREADGTFWDRIYLGFHSNADGGAGTTRGPMGLWDNRGTTLKQDRQKDFGLLMANLLHTNLNHGQNGVLFLDGYANNSLNLLGGAYGEIYGSVNDEMNSTIIEVAYHNNSADANLLKCPSARRVMAKSCYQAIVRHLATNNPAMGSTLLPGPPTHVAAVNDGTGAVTLRWRPPAITVASPDAATGYRIYRSANGYGFGHPVAVPGGAVTNVTLTNMPAGQIVYFQVCATNAGGESLASKTVGVRVSPSGFAPHLIVNGFERNDRVIAPTRYYTNAINNFVTRVIQRRINAHDYVVQHGEALAAAGRYFDSSDNSAIEAGDIRLTDYHAAYWNLGRESVSNQTFSGAEQSLVTSFLSGGGRLFVSGTEIGFALGRAAAPAADKAFLTNVLKTAYVADDAGTGTVTARGGGVFDGLGTFTFDYAGTGALYRANSPDRLGVAGSPPSTTALVYGASSGGGEIAGLSFGGGERLVILGFPFETITSPSVREILMAQTLDFFGDAPEDVPSVTITTADQTRPAGTEFMWINGVNNPAVAGTMTWSNLLTGASGTFDAQPSWSVPVSLATGVNTVRVTGVNYLLTQTASDTVRIEVEAEAGPEPVPGTLIDEPFDDAPVAPSGWSFSGVTSYSTTVNSGRAAPSVRFGTTSADQIVSPAFSGGTNLQFWIRANPSSGTTSIGSFVVEQNIGGSWSVLYTVVDPVNVGTIHAVALAETVTQLRFTWNKTSGNLAFDDVIVTGWISPPASGDTDGDGLPDWWEELYFDGPTAAHPDDDPDEDGMTNWQEYIAGTDPTRPESVLELEPLVVQTGAATNLVFRWPGVAGRVYSVWRATNAMSAYTQHVGGIAARPPQNVLTNPAPSALGTYYYQLRVQWPDAP